VTGGAWTHVAVLVAIALVVTACGDDEDHTAADLCDALAETEGVATRFQGFDPTDPEAALARLRPARITLGDLFDEAPEEARADLATEIDYVQDLIDALEDVVPGDAAAAATAVQSVTAAHPDVGTAADDLAAFAEREC
jgi:hypothetical protein